MTGFPKSINNLKSSVSFACASSHNYKNTLFDVLPASAYPFVYAYDDTLSFMIPIQDGMSVWNIHGFQGCISKDYVNELMENAS